MMGQNEKYLLSLGFKVNSLYPNLLSYSGCGIVLAYDIDQNVGLLRYSFNPWLDSRIVSIRVITKLVLLDGGKNE